MSFYFFFNAPATTEIYTYLHTLSLHYALPISGPTMVRKLWVSKWPASRAMVSVRPITRVRNAGRPGWVTVAARSEEHTSELQSLMRISYAVFCLKKKKKQKQQKKRRKNN